MRKHMAGPWNICQPLENAALLLEALTAQRLGRCYAVGQQPGGMIAIVDGEAEARLIAATPELLKACERVAEAESMLIGILNRRLPGWRSAYTFDDMFAEVSGAIAKAKGEQP